jgi:hypothetical protein
MSYKATFFFTNPDYRFILITPPPKLKWIRDDKLYFVSEMCPWNSKYHF